MLGSLLDQDEIEEFMAEADAVKLFLLTLMYTSSPIQEADAVTHHISLLYIHTLYLGSDLRGWCGCPILLTYAHHLLYFLTKKWFPTSYLAQARMFQQKNNQKVVCNMYNWAPILVSNLSFLLLPTGSPLMKLWQFWPFQSPPDHTKCYLTAKSSPQPSIHIFRKSKKKWQLFPLIFFGEWRKYERGGHFTPPLPRIR